jgi:polyphenol oxidase
MTEGCVHAFSRLADGNMSFSAGGTAASRENRRSFCGRLGIDYRSLVLPRQVHGSRIEIVKKNQLGAGAESAETGLPDTDAVVTAQKRLPIGVMTADCLPVLIADTAMPLIAAVHAGWRSTREHIAAQTVERMCREFGAKPHSLRCFFGPAIRQCCYAVGDEMAQVFPHSVRRTDGGLRLDLAAENASQLCDAGVRKENISDSGFCTYCSGDAFFSYRKTGAACGRMIAVIMLT